MGINRQVILTSGSASLRSLLIDTIEKKPENPHYDWPQTLSSYDLLITHPTSIFDYLFVEYEASGTPTEQLVKAFRENSDDRPVIVIGSNVSAGAVRDTFRAGADDFLDKENLSRSIVIESMRVARESHHRRQAAQNHIQVLAQLREIDNYAQVIINHSMDMIIAVDLSLRITEFNPAAEKTFGYSREEVMGEPVSMLYADPEQAWPVRMNVFKGGFAGEIHNRRKNGETFRSMLQSAAIKDAEGELLGVMGISREITSEQQMESKIRQVHEQLVKRTEELNRLGSANTERNALDQTIWSLLSLHLLNSDSHTTPTLSAWSKSFIEDLQLHVLAFGANKPTGNFEWAYRDLVNDLAKLMQNDPTRIRLRPPIREAEKLKLNWMPIERLFCRIAETCSPTRIEISPLEESANPDESSLLPIEFSLAPDWTPPDWIEEEKLIPSNDRIEATSSDELRKDLNLLLISRILKKIGGVFRFRRDPVESNSIEVKVPASLVEPNLDLKRKAVAISVENA